MKFLVGVRTSSALWAAPFSLGLTLFYYTVARPRQLDSLYEWAPGIVAQAVNPIYAFAYAVAASLAVWESGRLRQAAVWDLAPTRSRYRIAVNAVVPVLGLSWLMLILPASLGLIQQGVRPTLESTHSLLLGLPLCVAHAVIGFVIGVYAPRLIAAPIVAILTWTLVAFSVTSPTFWYRHISGQRTGSLMFGETVPLASLIPHFLFTGSIALAAVLLWMQARSIALRITVAVVIALAGTTVAQEMVDQEGANYPVRTGQAPMHCLGQNPTVCMPEAGQSKLPAARAAVASVFRDFQAAGVSSLPKTVIDSISDGRYPKRSTENTSRVALSRGLAQKDLRFRAVKALVAFPCEKPDPAKRREVLLWGAMTAGEEKAFRNEMSSSGESFDQSATNNSGVRLAVAQVRKMPAEAQAAWFKRTLEVACKAS